MSILTGADLTGAKLGLMTTDRGQYGEFTVNTIFSNTNLLDADFTDVVGLEDFEWRNNTICPDGHVIGNGNNPNDTCLEHLTITP